MSKVKGIVRCTLKGRVCHTENLSFQNAITKLVDVSLSKVTRVLPTLRRFIILQKGKRKGFFASTSLN